MSITISKLNFKKVKNKIRENRLKICVIRVPKFKS